MISFSMGVDTEEKSQHSNPAVREPLAPLTMLQAWLPYLLLAAGLTLLAISFRAEVGHVAAIRGGSLAPDFIRSPWRPSVLIGVAGIALLSGGGRIGWKQQAEYCDYVADNAWEIRLVREWISVFFVVVLFGALSSTLIQSVWTGWLVWTTLAALALMVLLQVSVPLLSAYLGLTRLNHGPCIPERLAPTYGLVLGVLAVVLSTAPQLFGLSGVKAVVASGLLFFVPALTPKLPRAAWVFLVYSFALSVLMYWWTLTLA